MGACILMDFFLRYQERVATLTLYDYFFSYEKSLSHEKQQKFIEMRQKPLRKDKDTS